MDFHFIPPLPEVPVASRIKLELMHDVIVIELIIEAVGDIGERGHCTDTEVVLKVEQLHSV
jgi:hypothetical protein